ncbi:unnamed protein product [Withania somnifera]
MRDLILHAVRVGDSFSCGRYIAQRKLGWGEFSTVWLAYDTLSSEFIALKIQKSAPQFAQAALHEIEVLSAIANGDPSNCKYVVRLIDHFKHTDPNGQHLCMVLEFLGDSLLRLIKHNRYKGLELNIVREICKCVLTSLDYLHRGLGIIHTDLKLENILLLSTINATKDPVRSGMTPILERPEGNPSGGETMNIIEKKLKQRARRAAARISGRRSSMGGVGGTPKPNSSLDGIDMRCKVVDFGNACWADKQFAQEIQTRQYRSPEVILQSGYSFSADMWSFACIAFELATGQMMFTPKGGEGFSEDEDHLAKMMELLGKIPRKIAVGGARSKDYFDRHGDLKRIRRLNSLLDFEPEKRPTAEQCLRHPWLNFKNLRQTEVKSESGVEKVNVGMSKLQIKVGK